MRIYSYIVWIAYTYAYFVGLVFNWKDVNKLRLTLPGSITILYLTCTDDAFLIYLRMVLYMYCLDTKMKLHLKFTCYETGFSMLCRTWLVYISELS